MNQFEMALAINQMLNEVAESQLRDVKIKEKLLADGSVEMVVTWQVMGQEKSYQIKIKEVSK